MVKLIHLLNQFSEKTVSKIPLRTILIVPFVLQVAGAVGLISYFSYKNGQQTVNSLVIRLQNEVNSRIAQHLDTYLAAPAHLNRSNFDLIDLEILNLQDWQKLEKYFYRQIQLANISYINFGSADGRFVGIAKDQAKQPPNFTLEAFNASGDAKMHVYQLDSEGARKAQLDVRDINPLLDPWYTDAVKAGKPGWSQIYQWQDLPIISISYSYPVFDRHNRLLGVLGTDLKLSHISNFLKDLKISPTGRVFIMERNGLVVACSDPQPLFNDANGKITRLKAIDSNDELTRSTAQHLTATFKDFHQIQAEQQIEFRMNNQQIFVKVAPWRDEFGLDWLIVEAVPEIDFMEQIHANNRNTFFLSLLALGICLLAGVLTAQWITRPILHLKDAATALANGEFDQSIVNHRQDELGVLTQAFNSMAAQLRQAFSTLQKANEQLERNNILLEQRVEERTIDLKQAKEDADAANVAKSEFLANMSHELRTPLNGILGYAQILLRSKNLIGPDFNGINIIYQCGSHLLTLINDILDLSKIEARKMELYPTALHFPSFLQNIVEICQVRADQKNLAFNHQFDPQLPTNVEADEKRLRQVLLNLLSNATKFTQHGGVTFKVGLVNPCSTARIYFQITDTGVGIHPDHLKEIFLPFQQVGDSQQRAEGTGLGLAISQKLVAMMGGQLEVQSKLNKGSIFYFEINLNVLEEWAEPAQLLEQGMIVGYTGEQRKILIVDDRWENRSVLTNLLEPIGFEVVEAENGQVALEQAEAIQPDLIISDLVMPVMDGFEMLRQLRRSPQLRSIQVVVSSASTYELDQQKSLDAGADAFLAKPVHADQLLEILKLHLDLEWVYEQLEHEFEPPVAINHPDSVAGEMVLPPMEILTALYKLARQGLLNNILNETTEIEQFYPESTAFTQKIRYFADDFQVNKLRSFLEEAIDSVGNGVV